MSPVIYKTVFCVNLLFYDRAFTLVQTQIYYSTKVWPILIIPLGRASLEFFHGSFLYL